MIEQPTFVPGQDGTKFYAEGDVIQHVAGPYYQRRNGDWCLMTDAEVQAYKDAQGHA